MGMPSEILSYVKIFCDSRNRFYGDITDQWADAETAAPLWFAEKKSAENLIGIADALSVIGAVNNNIPYPDKRISDAIFKLCGYDEHCWSTSCRHPMQMHLFNTILMKKQAVVQAKSVFEGIVDSCLKYSLTADENYITVWNFAPTPYNGYLKLNQKYIEGAQNQRLSEHCNIADGISIPSFGFRTFKTTDKCSLPTDVFENVETPYYIVECDFESNASKFFDKEQKNTYLKPITIMLSAIYLCLF